MPEISTNTFELKNQSLPGTTRSDIKVIVGDAKSTDLLPHVELSRWVGEAKFSMWLDTAGEKKKDITTYAVNDKITWGTANKKVEFFELAKKTFERDSVLGSYDLYQDGACEVLLTLKTKPASNVFNFKIATENLDFFYQPELTEAEKLDFTDRPPEIVGSYAVYHSTKMNNLYKAGKAFHIHRPRVWDSAGATVWGVLNVDTKSGILSITVDQKFIDAAVYPVFVDPTFGYETQGGTVVTSQGTYFRGSLFSGAAAGTATNISIYSAANTSGITAGVYTVSGTALTLVTGCGGNTAGSYSAAWRDVAINGTIAAVDYALECAPHYQKGVSMLAYDEGVANQGLWTDNAFNTTAPSSLTRTTLNTNKYSIHVDYTASGGGTAYYPKLSLCGVGR
jgi:hypothetical protein